MYIKKEELHTHERFHCQLLYQSNLTPGEAADILAWLGRVTEKMKRIAETDMPASLVAAALGERTTDAERTG